MKKSVFTLERARQLTGDGGGIPGQNQLPHVPEIGRAHV